MENHEQGNPRSEISFLLLVSQIRNNSLRVIGIFTVSGHYNGSLPEAVVLKIRRMKSLTN